MNSTIRAPSVSPPTTIKHVLIVDQQDMIRAILASFLRSWGFTAHIARNLTSACRKVVTDGPYDAIICNYDLPDGNAFDLVHWMREQQLEVPTIVPYGNLRPMIDPLDHVTLMPKPFDPSELRAAIEQAGRHGVGRGVRTIRRRSMANGRTSDIQHATSNIQ